MSLRTICHIEPYRKRVFYALEVLYLTNHFTETVFRSRMTAPFR